MKLFDYDKLSEEKKLEIANLIKQDNLQKSNEKYPNLNVKNTFYTCFGKRLIDLFISGIALLVFFPINLFIGIVTMFDVGFPIFFKQKRIGKNGKPFTMIKFRNMTNKTDENGNLLRADLRVTKWGRFVRSTSLDELLNFVNIFKGDMSIIGPRPLPLVYEGRFNRYHEARHMVKPGLDCPLRDPSKIMTWENRLENDAWYAEHISFMTDMKLLWLLFRETLFGKDKATRADGFSEGTFMGYFEDGTVMDSNHIPEKYYREVLGEK